MAYETKGRCHAAIMSFCSSQGVCRLFNLLFSSKNTIFKDILPKLERAWASISRVVRPHLHTSVLSFAKSPNSSFLQSPWPYSSPASPLCSYAGHPASQSRWSRKHQEYSKHRSLKFHLAASYARNSNLDICHPCRLVQSWDWRHEDGIRNQPKIESLLTTGHCGCNPHLNPRLDLSGHGN